MNKLFINPPEKGVINRVVKKFSTGCRTFHSSFAGDISPVRQRYINSKRLIYP